MIEKTGNKQHKGGRKPKANPSIHRYVFRLNDEENKKFLALFESSGMDTKAHFIVSLLFQREMKVVTIDRNTVDFTMKLTHFYKLFRSVAVNYNQTVKIIYRNFSEKKAAAYLIKLQEQTAEMAELCRKIIELIQEFEQKNLTNND